MQSDNTTHRYISQVSISIIDLDENSHAMTAVVPLYNVLQYVYADFRSMQSRCQFHVTTVNSSLHLTYMTLLKSLYVTSINESVNYFPSTTAVSNSDKINYTPCVFFFVLLINILLRYRTLFLCKSFYNQIINQ